MPRFYFHVRHREGPSGLAIDHEGDELPDAAAAREHALSVARKMIAQDRLTLIRDWMVCAFEIADADGRPVLTVPFSDTIADADGLD